MSDISILFTPKYRTNGGIGIGVKYPRLDCMDLLSRMLRGGIECYQFHISPWHGSGLPVDPLDWKVLLDALDTVDFPHPYELWVTDVNNTMQFVGLISTLPSDYTFVVGPQFNIVMEAGQQDDFIPVQEITSHHVKGEHAPLTIMAMAPPKGDQVALGAPAQYFDITGFCTMEQGSRKPVDGLRLVFQSGSPTVVGNNGVTLEALLAIEEYRLAKFQETKFACDHNEKALFHIRQALKHLQLRTIERLGLQPETPTLQ